MAAYDKMLPLIRKGFVVRQNIWVGSILLSTALGGSAASLGRHSGAAVIGRPLDVRVQALATGEEDLSAQCLKAEVFFGDNAVGPASVRTSVQRSAPDAEASVRIQTTIPVNEPIVSVQVRVGCNAPYSRRYVLLADPLSEPAAAPIVSAEPSAVASPPQGSVAEALSPQTPARPSARTASPPEPARAAAAAGALNADRPPAAPRSSATPRPSKPASVVRRPVEPAAPAPRLQLDPVDVNLAIERDPVLRLSLSLLSESTSNEQERAAAAQLWKALNASPEDILRDAQKLAVLEAEAKGLREQEARNKAALQDLEAQVEQSRYLSWMAYLLGGLLLASLLGLYLMSRRQSGAKSATGAAQKDWWAAGAGAAAQGGKLDPKVSDEPRKKDAELDLDLDLGDESDLMALEAARGLGDSGAVPLSNQDQKEFRGSQLGVSRSVATEELFDVQQQSDFFVSLGEFDQAIGVLRTHIAESSEPGALAFLDLFKLYHQLGRRDDYEKLRLEFNRKFNAGAPPFDQYSGKSRNLESYETAFGRIQALWPQPRVLDVIENSIFRDAADPESEVFDLEAYRELLLLHAIAKEVIQRDAKTTSDFQHTAIRPLKAAASGAGAALAADPVDRVTEPSDDIPHASPRLGLDVDLDALQEASAFEASLPEVLVPVEPTAKSAQAKEQEQAGNLIDFEVLDFMPPDESDKPD